MTPCPMRSTVDPLWGCFQVGADFGGLSSLLRMSRVCILKTELTEFAGELVVDWEKEVQGGSKCEG